MLATRKKFVLLLRNTCNVCFSNQPTLVAESPLTKVSRMEENPLFHPDLFHLKFSNCTGISAIPIPPWIDSTEVVYLYFTNEVGELFVGSSSSFQGPFTIQQCILEGNRSLIEFSFPEVVIDNDLKVIILFLRVVSINQNNPLAPKTMRTVLFLSKDGVTFQQLDSEFPSEIENIKIMKSGSFFYAIGRDPIRNCGVLFRSLSLTGNWEVGPRLIHRFRSGCLFIPPNDDQIWLFFTRIQDMPESILVTKMKLNLDWKEWPTEMSQFELIMSPEEDYEGALIPHWRSMPGRAYDEMNELRYPHIMIDQRTDKILVYYSIAGESGIAGAFIDISDQPQKLGNSNFLT